MKASIVRALTKSTTLKDAKKALLEVLQETHAQEKRIGYVAGIIFSDGPLHVKRNIKNLSDYTEFIRSNNAFPIFSPTDVFYEGLYPRLKESTFPQEARKILFVSFWRDILQSGFITDIFMTPRWQESSGATDEHNVAKKRGITIHYLS